MSDEKVIKIGKRHRAPKSKENARFQCRNLADTAHCSFCGRSNHEVIDMVKGPGVNICSECTMLAVQYLILKDKMISSDAQHMLEAFWGNPNDEA